MATIDMQHVEDIQVRRNGNYPKKRILNSFLR